MAKTKTPFLSLGSQGSIGNSITTQRSPGSTIIRQKPHPTDRYTLPQAYQRWLYQDYAHWWALQSIPTQRQYAADGVRFHLTGFQYWMKYNLANLPDIVAIWHLDQTKGGITPDSSPNALDATIIGASPIVGPIDNALHFDGINDWGSVPTSDLLLPMAAITLEFFFKAAPAPNWRHFINKSTAFAESGLIAGLDLNGELQWVLGTAAGAKQARSTAQYDDGQLHHFAGRWESDIDLFVDGQEVTYTIHDATASYLPNSLDLWFATTRGHTSYTDLELDHIILYNRRLDDITIQRHALRRYPA